MSKRKYTKEFKLKVLKEHEEGASFYSLEKKYGITLGTVKRWNSAFRAHGEEALAPQNSTLCRYTAEFKRKVVLDYLSGGGSGQSIAVKYGIHAESTVLKWVKQYNRNEKLEKQQKKLQQEINKMVQSKEVMERNIHAYDEDVKWQLAEPGALMSAKNYRDKKALPLVEKLKEVVKNLTIKCVQLTEQGKKLTAKVDGQQKQISRLTDKVMEQSDTIDRLQEKVSDLGRLERHLGREQVQLIVERC